MLRRGQGHLRTEGETAMKDFNETMKPLLGKRVRVTLSDKDPQIVQEGVLLGYGEGGDVEILGGDGLVYHAWPNLRIEELSD